MPGKLFSRPGRALAAFTAMVLVFTAQADPGRYLELEEFLAGALESVPNESEVLTIDPELRTRIESILGHRFTRLRLRYWDDGLSTAWILDEIGKTEPITIGVAVREGRVASVRILEFRESRGWEVRYPFFTDQFAGAGIDEEDGMDRHIDGITGATLSVAAVEKAVRAALVFDECIRETRATPSS